MLGLEKKNVLKREQDFKRAAHFLSSEKTPSSMHPYE